MREFWRGRLAGFASTLLLASLATAAEEPEFSQTVVGTVFGKAVTAKDVGLKAPIDPTVKFDARDNELWEQRGRISKRFGKPISDRFAEQEKIEVTPEEIARFQLTMHKSLERKVVHWRDELQKVQKKLSAPELSEADKSKLKEEAARYRRNFDSEFELLLENPPDRDTRKSSIEIAKHRIRAWKIERALHRKYGGRIIFQQFGAEALDARSELYEEAEKQGDLKFFDPGVRHLFYYYYTSMKHIEAGDDKVLEKPWFFNDNP